TAFAGFVVPAVDGVTASPTDVPPAGAGMLSVAVSVTMPFGPTEAVAGDSVTVVGNSAAPSTRTWAVFVPAPSVAVSVTSVVAAPASSLTVAVVMPFGTVTLPPTTV